MRRRNEIKKMAVGHIDIRCGADMKAECGVNAYKFV